MGNIWLTSDLHFNHNRQFIYKPRGFKNIMEMNAAILVRHNKIVQPDDDVYILGDLMLGDNELGLEFIKQLKGKLHIVYGNHDTNVRKELYKMLPNVVECNYALPIKYRKYNFYCSHFPTLTGNLDDINKPLKARIINLCGHNHDKNKFCDMNKGIIYHCELDAHNNAPVLLDTIINDLQIYLAGQN